MTSSNLDECTASRGWMYSSFQASLLVVLTTLVSIFYERGHDGDAALISMTTWSLTPWACFNERDVCVPALHPNRIHTTTNTSTECILESNHHLYVYAANLTSEKSSTSLCALIGETPLYEREGKNLFSIMGIPFLLLSTQVVSTAFSLNYIRKSKFQGSSMHGKTLKKSALALLVVFSIAFLFIQITWKIPGNNLFLVQLFIWLTVFLLATLHASYFSENATRQILTLRLVELVITMPLFACAVLAAAGNTSTNDLSIAFFAVLFGNCFLLLLDMEKKTYHDQPYRLQHAHGIVLLNAWLCLIPFILQCIQTLEKKESTVYSPWTKGAVIVLLLFEVSYALAIALSNWLAYSKLGNRCAQFLQETWCYHDARTSDCLERFMDILCLTCHGGVILCIMGGAFIVFPPPSK